MPSTIRRPARPRALLETLEPRRLLSALGFGAVIHPAGKHHGAAQPPGPPVGMIQADPSWHQGAGAGAESHFSPMDVFADLLSSHVVLNNAGYNAVDDAQDSIPWTGTLGTAHLPVAFSPATTPQNTLTRNLFGSAESLFITFDWGDGSPQTMGTFQSISPAAYTIAATHTWSAPGDYRVTAFLIANGPGVDLPFVLSAAAGVAHVAATPESTQPAVELPLPLYDPRHYIAPAYPQIKLPTDTPTDDLGFSRIYDFVVA